MESNHQFTHQVNTRKLERYLNGELETIRATCGVEFAPRIPIDTTPPKCPECFPPPRFPFAIAA